MEEEPPNALPARPVLRLAVPMVVVHVDELPVLERLVAQSP
jgi:hypothetical protein